MIKLVFWLLVATPLIAASIADTQRWEISGTTIDFHYSDEDGLLIESRCYNNFKCQSTKNYQKADASYYRNNYSAGREPGVIVCKQQFKGTIVIGKSFMGENSFCRFRDGSLIATGSLFRPAKSNK
jgi:hypothetical protein